MNVCFVSGKLAGNAKVVQGKQTRILKFVVQAKHGYDFQAKRNKYESVPCVLFDPSEAIENLFSREGEGVFIEFMGRVITNEYQFKGERRFNAEVVVFSKYLEIIRS